ncbi:MAG: hypothetical protein ACR2PI_00220 [Hyphomicrobiaceae bacterium]
MTGYLTGTINSLFAIVLAVSVPYSASLAAEQAHFNFRRVQPQFIAALGDPNATSGSGAQRWGIWRKDPGPRGVWLHQFPILKAAGGFGPHNWQFDDADWWLDENGIIMEKPDFPVQPGHYLVTGEREVTTVLTIHPKNDNGEQRWELANGAKLFDVTHLPCRSARYTASSGSRSCSPAMANKSAFPVKPGATMPPVSGCKKMDYAVLIVIGLPLKK